MAEASLTEEQKAFIAECDEEFKDRYTDKDEQFMKLRTMESKDPPIMDPWYNKPPRNFDWSRQNQSHDHGGRRNQGWKRRHDRSDRNSDHHKYKRNYTN